MVSCGRLAIGPFGEAFQATHRLAIAVSYQPALPGCMEKYEKEKLVADLESGRQILWMP